MLPGCNYGRPNRLCESNITQKTLNVGYIDRNKNDLPNDFNTIKKVEKVIQSIREIDINEEIQINISGIINRTDNNFAGKMEERNTEVVNYCNSKIFVFINNAKLDSSSLKGGRLHLNARSTSLLCRNFAECFKAF